LNLVIFSYLPIIVFSIQKEGDKIKIPESIRGEKEGEKNLTFACDSVKIENEKKEVLKTQLVTTCSRISNTASRERGIRKSRY